MNNLVCSNQQIRLLSEKVSFKDYLGNLLPFEKIDVLDLTDIMFEDNPYILNKYFFLTDHMLDRLQCFNITNEEYVNVIDSLERKPEHEEDFELETASLYWKKKVFAVIIAKDLGIDSKRINMSGYIHNLDYYEYYDFDDNSEYLKDKFREEEHETPQYIDRTCVVDLELIDDLYDTCIMLTKERLAMIFEVFPILCAIDDIRNYTDGFNTNCLKGQMDYLRSRHTELGKIFHSYKKGTDSETGEEIIIVEDKLRYEIMEWINQGNNDYTLYGSSPETLSDYISTYHKILCKVNSIFGDYTREDFDILVSYLETVIPNDIDKHISRFFATKDIDDYMMGYINRINSKKIRVDYTDEYGYEEGEDAEECEDSDPEEVDCSL